MGEQVRKLFDKIVENRMRRAIALTLAIIVTFTTTYALVLPAISLDKSTAETSPGVSMGGDRKEGKVSFFKEKGLSRNARSCGKPLFMLRHI